MKTQKSYLTISLLAALMLLTFIFPLAPTAQAQPFELDGNAVSGAGVDWDIVNTGGGGALANTGLVSDRPEPANPNTAQFTGGGAKDELDISNWKWRSGTPPAKDDITHAYAAAFIEDGDFILTFGMDRYDTSGDAQLGFWFLQDKVQPITGGTFSGVHMDGDLLVLVNFSGGGDVPTINVYKWNNNGVESLGVGGDVLCNGFIPDGKNFCGITNANNETAPWSYDNKDVGVTTEFPPAAFFEGAINVTEAIGTPACFTNFLAESRSSTSITAVLKDFATPTSGFNVCGINVTKDCSNPRLNSTEDKIIYDIAGMVTNNGFGTLYNIGLTDAPAADGVFKWVNCDDSSEQLGTFPLSSLVGAATACYQNTITVLLGNNGLTDTVTVESNTESDNSGSKISDTASDLCENLQVSPAIKIVKDCDPTQIEVQSDHVAVKVNIKGTVCNIGDSVLTNVTVTDNNIAGTLPLKVGEATVTTLIKPADPSSPEETTGACAAFAGNYLPTTTATSDPILVIFSDTATASATDIFGNAITPATDQADCPLCPTCPECP